jgi:hypothetical protein
MDMGRTSLPRAFGARNGDGLVFVVGVVRKRYSVDYHFVERWRLRLDES